jgi:hypothetical protein
MGEKLTNGRSELQTHLQRDLLRVINLSGGSIVLSELASKLLLTEELLEKEIKQLINRGVFRRVFKDSTPYIEIAIDMASYSDLLEQLDAAAISQRAKSNFIDVVGRLEWIEDANEMITKAKRSYANRSKIA